MNSRERILAVSNLEKPDKIPTDIWATNEIWELLAKTFGSFENALSELKIDLIRWVAAEYCGHAIEDGSDMWGSKFRVITNDYGSYTEQTTFLLASAKTIDDIENYNWPAADWFDYSKIKQQASDAREKGAVMSGYMAPFYFHNNLRGLEQSLIDPYDDPDFTHYLLGKLSDYFYETHYRIFESADGLIDIAQVTDDFGSQNGPIISLAAFREFYKPHLKRFMDLCKNFNIKVFHHDDGSMIEFLPDLIEMGIDILNPIQHNCPGMDMDELKHKYGKIICFHGAIENQSILPFGTPEDVRKEVRDCIDSLASDGTGYILAPCHNIQAVTPIENIIAMYDEAYYYGKL